MRVAIVHSVAERVEAVADSANPRSMKLRRAHLSDFFKIYPPTRCLACFTPPPFRSSPPRLLLKPSRWKSKMLNTALRKRKALKISASPRILRRETEPLRQIQFLVGKRKLRIAIQIIGWKKNPFKNLKFFLSWFFFFLFFWERHETQQQFFKEFVSSSKGAVFQRRKIRDESRC